MNAEDQQFILESKNSGRHYGYPQCCIDFFCKQTPTYFRRKPKPTHEDRERYKAACVNGVFTGFIPCPTHAQQIKEGKIKLVDLIVNRHDALAEFPNEWSMT